MRPRCRCCGKPIPKRTDTHYFRPDDAPANLEEAQRRFNQPVISVGYSRYDGVRYLHKVSVWDGDSYAPVYEFFCKLACAAAFGELAARVTPLQTQAYVSTIQALGRNSSRDG